MSAKFDISVQGYNQISDAYYSDSIDIVRKAEFEFTGVVLSDEEIVLPVSKLTPLYKIIVYGTGVNLNVNGNNIPVNGVLYWDVDLTYSATITGVAVNATSETATDIKISLIGV